ncbi:hypothetical protein GYMLUDRAFT_250873 [Collybiopsis luxurians FD-317 M1]|uniref:Unplaced genomic scaffold GYMLUscaffold_88, whole genome shotgun sequence n=1 Tax=Collybiopsis luxurians FD-317 M1 TaxID=944289 RepID=A0A0D0CD57_9AGAR|nr:hypothetical protein GYMLUDRAFT_250873 [Collybiopsis luxurians FD-317 M1]
MQPAHSDPKGKPGRFVVANKNLRTTSFAVSAELDDMKLKEYSAIYITLPTTPGPIVFTLADEVPIWFRYQQETGTMSSNIGGDHVFDVKYGEATTKHTIYYDADS